MDISLKAEGGSMTHHFRLLVLVQGLFHILTGLWSVFDISSFYLGGVSAAGGAVMLRSLKFKGVPLSTAWLGMILSVVTFCADVHFASTGEISETYLIDALLELYFSAGWGFFFILKFEEREFRDFLSSRH